MEKHDNGDKKKNEIISEELKHTINDILQWTKHITVIDLSGKKLKYINKDVKFPPNLKELNLSHNILSDIPTAVLQLENLKSFNVSSNSIKYFDETPKFCHSIVKLDLSYNQLHGPPYWIFSDAPKILRELSLNNNSNITFSLDDSYIQKLLQCTVRVMELHIRNCKLNKFVILLQSFPNIKILSLGTPEYYNMSSNNLQEIPCPGLNKVYDIEILNLCNTNIYTVKSDIELYKHLKDLDLSQNNISSLPEELCELINLESCILSYNRLLYLPDNMFKLDKLKVLRLDNNQLCMTCPDIHLLHNLYLLDLYENHLCEVPELPENLLELDLALNYFDEPGIQEYLDKKQKLRSNNLYRSNGRKLEVIKPENEYSDATTDDEEQSSTLSRNFHIIDYPEFETRSPSPPEDWDSDDYWIPLYYNNVPPPLSPWHYFVKQKIEEGNFCPFDLHPVSITEQVKYEKLCNPHELNESDGQFDDYSDDDT